MKKFNGEKLKFARLYNGFTVEELAKKLGISAQAESLYEMGKVIPPFNKLLVLSKELNFPVSFFLSEDCILLKSGASYFRSLMKTPKKYRTEQKLKVELLARLYAILSEYVEFPRLNIPTDLKEFISPEEAAMYLRSFWKLGEKPIPNLLRLLESQGIIVLSFDTKTQDIDAFSQYFSINNKSTFFVAYSNNKNSAARINFDLAHELGHILLHNWTDDTENCSREEFKQKEKEANQFASAFLLPQNSFIKEVSYFSHNLDHYIELKKKWRVSIAAMIYRACDLNIISMSQYQYLIRMMNKKGMRYNEPLDNILEIPYPRLLRDSVELLVVNDVFTKQELIEEFANFGLAMEPRELEKLFLLENGFFTENEKYNDSSPLVLKNK